jgi:hypothetical protein
MRATIARQDQQVRKRQALRWKLPLTAGGLILLISTLVFLPFAWKLGFYRDDWYMLWSANVRGAASIIDLFSIDRPFMGYTYSLTYSLLGNTPVTWQLYAIALKMLGAAAVYGIMRLVWPEHRPAALAAAILYLIYPGFLGQPNAATKTNQLLSLTSVLGSIWLTGMAVKAGRRRVRILLITASILLMLLNLLLYEYMIGLEVLRVGLLWLVSQQTEPLALRGRIQRLFRQWWPYLLPGFLFVIWRLFLFKSDRVGADQFSIVQSILADPRSALLQLGLQSILDPLEALILAWFTPFSQYALESKTRTLVYTAALGALAALLVWAGIRFVQRWENRDDEIANGNRPVEVVLLGAVSLYGAIFPVLAVGRDIHYSSGFDKYTLHASPAVAILLAGFIFGFLRSRARQIFLAVLIFFGVGTHYLNEYHWQRFWEEQKTLWWQLSWRAPGLRDGTTLLISLPVDGFQEDYEAWAPAQMIYRPGLESLTIGSQVLNPDTLWDVWSGVVEERTMRKLVYERDFTKSLLLYLPSDASCLKVIDSQDIYMPLKYDNRLTPILKFSNADQIDPTAQPPSLNKDIFGDEPAHTWCYYYQNAERLKQAGDWKAVASMADEAIDMELQPADVAEWLPFYEAYVWRGDESKAERVRNAITENVRVTAYACDALNSQFMRFGQELQQKLIQSLCSDAVER